MNVSPLLVIWIIIKTIIGLLSVLGASMIIISVCRSKKNRANVQQRILAAMSVFDLVFALMMVTGSLWFPASPKVPAIGNEVTCDIQGFINIVCVFTTLLYNDSLALYYLLIIKYKWRPLRMKKIDIWFHITPIACGLSFAIPAAALGGIGAYQEWSSGCFIKPAPDTAHFETVYHLLLGGFSVIISALLFSLCCLLLIYFHVRTTDKRTSRWSTNQSNRTKQVSKQCLLFFFVIALPWTFFMIYGILNLKGNYQEWMDFLEDFFVPTAGCLNGYIYFRIRFGRLSDEHPDATRRQIMFAIVRDTLFPCCCKNFAFQGKDGDDGKDLEPTLEANQSTGSQHENEEPTLAANQFSGLQHENELPDNASATRVENNSAINEE